MSDQKHEGHAEEQELRDEALEEVAGGFQNRDVVQVSPPPFFTDVDSL